MSKEDLITKINILRESDLKGELTDKEYNELKKLEKMLEEYND